MPVPGVSGGGKKEYGKFEEFAHGYAMHIVRLLSHEEFRRHAVVAFDIDAFQQITAEAEDGIRPDCQRFIPCPGGGPEHAFQRNDIPFPGQLFCGDGVIVSGERLQYGSVGRDIIFRLHGPEEHRERPGVADYPGSKAAVFPGMCQCIGYSCLALFYEFAVVQQVSQAQQTVGVICCLLIAPPVLPVSPHAGNLPGPEAGVVRIGKRLRMACKAFLLVDELLF